MHITKCRFPPRAQAVVTALKELGTGLGEAGEVVTKPCDPLAIITTHDHRGDPGRSNQTG